MLDGFADMVRRTVGPHITVALDKHDGVWKVLCDRNQLESALLNVAINANPATPGFRIIATSPYARILEEVANAVRGEEAHLDARGIQPYLTHKLSRDLNAGLTVTGREGVVELAAG